MRIKASIAGLVVLAAIACQKSETIAPDGSTVTLNANPAQVILVNGQQEPGKPVTIIATVRNAIGVALPGQDVRFTTTNGVLTPAALTPVSTDNLGNATCELNGATAGPTVTGTSGKATASLTLTSANGQVTQILLTADHTSLQSCGAPDVPVLLTATALGSDGTGVSGFTIIWEKSSASSSTSFTPGFSPTQGVTDANGVAKTSMSLPNCASECLGNDTNGSPKNCTALIRAGSQGDTTVSTAIQITDNIP